MFHRILTKETRKNIVSVAAATSILGSILTHQIYSSSISSKPSMSVTTSNAFHDDDKIRKVTLRNEKGCECDIMTMGASILSFKCPDRYGKVEEVTIQVRSSLKDFLEKNDKYYGAVRTYINFCKHTSIN